jgi:hypothetical protein
VAAGDGAAAAGAAQGLDVAPVGGFGGGFGFRVLGPQQAREGDAAVVGGEVLAQPADGADGTVGEAEVHGAAAGAFDPLFLVGHSNTTCPSARVTGAGGVAGTGAGPGHHVYAGRDPGSSDAGGRRCTSPACSASGSRRAIW